MARMLEGDGYGDEGMKFVVKALFCDKIRINEGHECITVLKRNFQRTVRAV